MAASVAQTCFPRSAVLGRQRPKSRRPWKTGLRYLAISLPGCAADGRTYSEALANVEVVIKEWIETATELARPIPQSKGRLVFA